MGDPGKKRKKYKVPSHPWQKERIDEERILRKDYGTKNKKEIYKLESLLRKFKREAKRLIALSSEQADLEKKHLLEKLQALKLITHDADLDDILAVSLKGLMERRIQTLLVRKGMARTVKQARQFITHRHIMVKGKFITSPSTLLDVEQEGTLEFVQTSALSNASHPEREIKKEEEKEEKQKKKPKKEKKEKPKKETKKKKEEKQKGEKKE